MSLQYNTGDVQGTHKGLIKYTSRDYESLMEEFWAIVPTLTELWKPDAEADPGVVLGKWLASVADVLGVNLDIIANELYAPSVSQRKNAEKLFALIGYELGWFTAARTEVTFKNNSESVMRINFGFNGENFCTVSANTDFNGNASTITYNILPNTNGYGATDSRSRRSTITETINVFDTDDVVSLQPGESVTRVAIEGQLRSSTVTVQDVLNNNLIIKLPSQTVDTTAVWLRMRSPGSSTSEFLATQWVQCASPAEFITPEPRFAVTYDSYSNAQIQVSNYLKQLDDYEDKYLTVFWIDCSGLNGCVSENVLGTFLQARDNALTDAELADLTISNLSNTLEKPHTYTITGKSPETAKEAYFNSRNYINTWDSLITLPDFNRFLNREPGVDCGYVIDCQKASELNRAVYNDYKSGNITKSQAEKMYIRKYDFPVDGTLKDWGTLESISDACSDYFENDTNEIEAISDNFKTYVAMCFAIHNDFNDSEWGEGQTAKAQIQNKGIFKQYKPPVQFIHNVIRDYRPLQAMSVELKFGYLRVFDFYIVGQIYTKLPVSKDVGDNIIKMVKEAIALFFSPANRHIGQKPTVMEVVNVVKSADSRIDYFDAGSLNNPVINWRGCDVEYFNAISFARHSDPGVSSNNIRIAPECLTA